LASHRRHQPIPAIRLAEQAMVHRIFLTIGIVAVAENAYAAEILRPIKRQSSALHHLYSESASHAFVREPRQFVHGTLIALARSFMRLWG
jgi:hypothetical protein